MGYLCFRRSGRNPALAAHAYCINSNSRGVDRPKRLGIRPVGLGTRADIRISLLVVRNLFRHGRMFRGWIVAGLVPAFRQATE